MKVFVLALFFLLILCVGFGCVSSELAESLFYVSLALMVVSMFVSYIAPLRFVRVNPMPFTAKVENNFGKKGLQVNTILYVVFHQHKVNKITHYTFVFDQLAWFAVSTHFFGTVGDILLLVLLIIQSASFGSFIFVIFSTALWLALMAISATMQTYVENWEIVAFKILLVNTSWRFIGHLFDYMPPHVANNNKFASLALLFKEKRVVQTLILGIFGFISELIAGLPFRLFHVQMYWTLQAIIQVQKK